ncbi:MAG: hypothetical protein ACOC9P_00165 [bacterium]
MDITGSQMRITIEQTSLHRIDLTARMPFRYGIASLTQAPHVLLVADVSIDGRTARGIAADILPPKWFTKQPDTRYEEDDLPAMLAVINAARQRASELGPTESIFELWRGLYKAQQTWAAATEHPPLLWHFGVSLVERAAIDALCRSQQISFHTAVHRNALGIDPGAVHKALAGQQPSDFLPATPRAAVAARHTVGLGDPLSEQEIAPNDRIDDGLPQSLAAAINAYGLRYFKVKLSGNEERDLPRLRELTALLQREAGDDYQLTLDGNEQYRDVERFAALWREMAGDPALRPMIERTLFVEQPFHRDIALHDDTGTALRSWTDRPAMIIDESDATTDSLPLALSLGYSGTSHKNCKGVIKGILNACLLEHHRRTTPQRAVVLSAEDLANVGPIALLQDLAVVATLGIEHVERNGHHYFRGLGMLPEHWQRSLLEHHPELYETMSDDTPTLRIVDGQLDLTGINAAPFGVQPSFDPSELPLACAP